MSDKILQTQSAETSNPSNFELSDYQKRDVGPADLQKLYERIATSPHLKMFPAMSFSNLCPLANESTHPTFLVEPQSLLE